MTKSDANDYVDRWCGVKLYNCTIWLHYIIALEGIPKKFVCTVYCVVAHKPNCNWESECPKLSKGLS